MSFASKGSTVCLVSMCILGALTAMKSCNESGTEAKIDVMASPDRFVTTNKAQQSRQENEEIFSEGGVTAVLGGRLSGAHKRKYVRTETVDTDRRQMVRQQQAARARRNQSTK